MFSKILFLKQNDEIVGVFDDKDIAIEEKVYLKEEFPLDKIVLVSLGMAELSNYPDEYEYAREVGVLDELGA